ncbi:phage tail tube protein [Alkalihalobacillus sp. FSL W8-0930]
MTFKAQNIVSGKEGRVFWNGQELAQVTNIEANVEKEKTQKKILGRVMSGNKTLGASGSGTMTLHKVTSQFVKMMVDYKRTGIDEYFTVEVVNDDKGARRGTQRVTLFDVNIDSVRIAALDVDSEGLEEEVPFTFDDFDMPQGLSNNFR